MFPCRDDLCYAVHLPSAALYAIVCFQLVTVPCTSQPHRGRVVSRSGSPVSVAFGNSLKPVKLVVLSFSALLSYHIVNVVASLVNAAGTNLAMVDLVLGGGGSRVCALGLVCSMVGR